MLKAGGGNGLWESLVDLAVMLCREKVDLDDLNREIQMKKSEERGADHEKGETGGRKITCFNSGKILNSTQDSVSCGGRSKKPGSVVRNYDLLLDHDRKGETGTEGKPITKLILKFNGKVLNPPINIQGIKKPAKRSREVEEEATHKRSKTLSDEIKKRILDYGGREESALLVIQKKLFQSDVDPDKCRLSVPHGQVNGQFLKKLLESEVARLNSASDGIPVTLIGAGGEEHAMSLRNWKSNNMYALVGGWKNVCHDYGLETGQAVQLWCFRRNSHLCFVLV